MRLALSILVALCAFAGAARADCNGQSGPCTLVNGTYHIVLPKEAKFPVPAIFLLHGYGGEGVGSIRNQSMVNLMLERGYAVIAPDGQPRTDGDGRSWDFHPDRPATRDETAFLKAVADDAAARFDLQRDQMLLAGFSIGGSMVSYVACADPNAFAAYAPVAGSFWLPQPETCAGPVRLLHTHGLSDNTVPMIGRQIEPGFTQGNVYKAMETWRETNGCTSKEPEITESLGIYTVQRWRDCKGDARLDFALHPGGHSIPKGWAKMAVDWFEER